MPFLSAVSVIHADIRKSHLSPLIKNSSEFDVFVVEDKVYEMGKIKDLI